MSLAMENTSTENGPMSTAFEDLPLQTSKHIDLIQGLPGFENLHKFIIAETQDYAPFCVLKSVEQPEISMLTINANLLTICKDVNVPESALDILGMQKTTEAEQYIILKADPRTQEITANVKAPLVVNPKSGLGNQVIIDDPQLSMEYPLKHELS